MVKGRNAFDAAQELSVLKKEADERAHAVQDLSTSAFDLFSVVDAVPQSPEKHHCKGQSSEDLLKKMVAESEELKYKLEIKHEAAQAESGEVNPELERTELFKSGAEALADRTHQLIAFWEKRPQRQEQDKLVDDSLKQMFEEAQTSINQANPCIDALEAINLRVLITSLESEINKKAEAIMVDTAAIEHKIISESPNMIEEGEEHRLLNVHRKGRNVVQSQSQGDHEGWKTHCKGTLVYAEECIKQCKAARQSAVDMRKRRSAPQAMATKGVVEIFMQRLKQWRALIATLPPQITSVEEAIERLENILPGIEPRRQLLIERQERAERRLATRNARPHNENKKDDAEIALLAEIDEAQILQHKLLEHEALLHVELEKLRDELSRLIEELREAKEALAYDEKCLQNTYKATPEDPQQEPMLMKFGGLPSPVPVRLQRLIGSPTPTRALTGADVPPSPVALNTSPAK